MAATLGLVFTGRPRLLPLALALLAAALTFGALALVGGVADVASIAVLPVLVGLAVDYAIQFQSRVAEAGSRATARRGASDGEGAARPGRSAGGAGPSEARERRGGGPDDRHARGAAASAGGDARAAALAGADGPGLRRAARRRGRDRARCAR